MGLNGGQCSPCLLCEASELSLEQVQCCNQSETTCTCTPRRLAVGSLSFAGTRVYSHVTPGSESNSHTPFHPLRNNTIHNRIMWMFPTLTLIQFGCPRSSRVFIRWRLVRASFSWCQPLGADEGRGPGVVIAAFYC